MIDKETIEAENLTYDEIIEVIMEVTGYERILAVELYEIEMGIGDGDVIVEDGPANLEAIMAAAPEGDQAIGQYLMELVAEETITIDDVTFLLDNKEMFAKHGRGG